MSDGELPQCPYMPKLLISPSVAANARERCPGRVHSRDVRFKALLKAFPEIRPREFT